MMSHASGRGGAHISSAASGSGATPSPRDTLDVHATGFGPFGCVLVNPSDLLVNSHLLTACAVGDVASCVRLVSCSTLIVGVAAATAAIAELWAKAEADTTASSSAHVLVAHLGVDVNAQTVRVERCAYNEATFRLPDAAGLQPDGEAITPSEAPRACRETSVPVDAVVAAAASGGHSVAASNDAGRYLCNYAYWLSLRHAEAANASAVARGDARRFHALFVHIPSTDTLALPAQAACVAAVLRACATALAAAPPVRVTSAASPS